MRETKGKMRRLWSMLTVIAAAWVGILCIGMLTLQVSAATPGKVSAKSANIRAEANTSSSIVASLLQNDEVSIAGKLTGTDGKTWYKIHVDANTTGYIRADLVSVSGDVPTLDEGSTTGNANGSTTGSSTGSSANDTVTAQITKLNPVSAKVKGSSVNVRKNCTTSSSIVTSVPKGTVLTIVGQTVGTDNKTWYQVSFISNNQEVSGFIRSDFVDVEGELTPYTETPVEPDPTPTQDPVEEEKPVTEVTQDWYTLSVDGKWMLVENATGNSWNITELLELSKKNAADLTEAKADLKSRQVTIIVLVILLVVVALAIALFIFRFKDLFMEEVLGMREEPVVRRRVEPQRRPAGSAERRPSGSQSQRPAGSQSQRPTGSQNQRPAGSQSQRPTGSQNQRPAGSQSQRPTGSQNQRPAGSQGQRPAGGQGQRPVANQNARPAGAQSVRPATAQGGPSVDTISPAFDMTDTNRREEQIRRETAKSLEEQQIQRKSAPVGNADSAARKSKNFMTDDEFEFEFLNWDGEEEQQ